MGDHFVLLVDRLLTESTLEAAIESANLSRRARSSPVEEGDPEPSLSGMDPDHIPSAIKLALCRICHDEDDYRNMDAPCSCRGSLKYAHRKCVQSWCNEKGDTTCEICQQQFKRDYTAPPLYHYGEASMNFRGNLELTRRDLHNARQFIAMVTTADDDYPDPDLDEFSAPSPSSLLCCRIIAVTFMVLLMLRSTLPIVTSGAGEYSFTLSMLLVLRTIGLLLPIYFMVKAFTAIQHRCWFQDPDQLSQADSDDESDLRQV